MTLDAYKQAIWENSRKDNFEIIITDIHSINKKLLVDLVAIPKWQFTRFSSKQKNDYVTYSTSQKNSQLEVNYVFKDFGNRIIKFNAEFEISSLIKDSDKFGIPPIYTKKNRIRSDQLREWEFKRQQDFQNGLFRLEGNLINPDPKAMLAYYAGRQGKIIANQLEKICITNQHTSILDRLNLALAFVQDIPYGVPREVKGRFRSGVIPPSEILYNGYGDCDSKCYFFASIINNWLPANNLALALIPNHMIFLLHNPLLKGGHHIQIDRKSYHVVEVAGPGKLPIGESKYASSLNNFKIATF